MINIEIKNAQFMVTDMERIFDCFQDKSASKESYLNMVNQIISQSQRNNRWNDYKMEQYGQLLMKVEGSEKQIVIESQTDFFLLLRALLDKRQQITQYPSLVFDIHSEQVQRFRLYQFLDSSRIEQADLDRDIIEIQSELVSLNTLYVLDTALLSQLKTQIFFSLQSLTIKLNSLSQSNIHLINSFLNNSHLTYFAIHTDVDDNQLNHLDEEIQEISEKFKVNKCLQQISLSSNCLDYFHFKDLLSMKTIEIYFQDYQKTEFNRFKHLKNIQKVHFSNQKYSQIDQTLQQEIMDIIQLNVSQLIQLTIKLECIYTQQQQQQQQKYIIFDQLNKLTILESQKVIDEKIMFAFLSNQLNLKQINIETSFQFLNQNLFLALSSLFSHRNSDFSCYCYQIFYDKDNKQKSSLQNIYSFHPDSVNLYKEYYGSYIERESWFDQLILDIKNVTHLKHININLQLNIIQLEPQDQEDIISFICSNKSIESIKVSFSQQNLNNKIYSILAANLSDLTCLREGNFGFNLKQEFNAYQDFQSIMDKCLTLPKLVSLGWQLNGHGEDFEVFAIESLIKYHSIIDLQIENHVKGAYCIEIFMDYIDNIDKQIQLWLKIKELPIEQINYFMMKKKLSGRTCFDLGYEFLQNQYVQEFTTSTYDCKVKQEETIDHFFYIFYSHKMSLSLFYKHIFSLIQFNPLLTIYDLYL